jgi:hypothetical protein
MVVVVGCSEHVSGSITSFIFSEFKLSHLLAGRISSTIPSKYLMLKLMQILDKEFGITHHGQQQMLDTKLVCKLVNILT